MPSTADLHRDLIARANALLNAREVEAALAAFGQAAASGADPNPCDAGRWQCLALLNRYPEAWALSDAIAARAPEGPYRSPGRFWDGLPLAGKRVMLRSLHGFGDALQMIRYAPLLREQAASLTVEAHPALVPLLRACEGVEEVITWSPPPAVPPEWDSQIEVMELPWIFRGIPANGPWLDAAKLSPSSQTCFVIDQIDARKQHRLQIGISWRSSDWNPLRSIPFAALPFVLPDALPRQCDLYSLQQAGRLELDAAPRIENIEADFEQLALRMAHLDVILTVDGVLAHLAGALGLPVLLLLPFAADWRWGLTSTTPWYPRTRLFRQQTPGDWSRPLAEAVEHLSRYR